jgi:hypothetical protein
MNKEEMRFKAAAMAMQGQISNAEWIRYLAGLCEADGTIPAERIASHSVEYADALLSALYASTEESSPVPDADGWIDHRPGDAMPCLEGDMIHVKLRSGSESVSRARYFDFGLIEDAKDDEIIAWRPAK